MSTIVTELALGLPASSAAGSPGATNVADLLATGNDPDAIIGAGSWTDECVQALRDRDVVIMRDNDEAGIKRAQEAAEHLHSVASRVRVCLLPDLPPKGDVSDWIEAGGTLDQLQRIIEDVPDWSPGDASAFNQAPEEDEPAPKKKSASPDKAAAKVKVLEARDAGIDTEKPPPRRWLLGNQFCRRFLSGLVAPGSTGKSALRMLQCLSLAIGRSLTGQHVFRQCRVLMVSLEDDEEELQRKILAARLHYGIGLGDVKSRLFYATPRGIKLAEMKNGSRQIGLLEKQLRVWIERHGPDLVVLDPYVKLHALEENDNSAMDFVCDLLATLAIEYDIAIDAPHHTKKGQLAPGDPDAGRGGSAARDAGRLIYSLTAMSEEEAKQFGINPEERAAYIRLDKAKVNLAPPARVAEWFRLVGGRSTTATTNILTVTKCKPSSPGSRRKFGMASHPKRSTPH